MLKSLLLSTTRYFDAEKETGSKSEEAKKVRDSIKVESSKKEEKEPEKKEVEEVEEVEEKEPESESEEVETEENEQTEEETEEEVKALTPEEFQKQIDKLQKTIARLQKRVGKTTAERNNIAQQLNDAQQALNTKVKEGEGLTEEEVERRANLKADEKAAEREFTKVVNSLNKAATKVDKDFPAKIKELTEDIAIIPGQMIGILEDLDNDNGGAVLAYLANNPDEYEEIFDLPIGRMATRLGKLSDKLIEENKPKPKKISKAPEPLKGIKGSEKSPSILPANPTKNMDEFVRMRAVQVAERRKAKYGY